MKIDKEIYVSLGNLFREAREEKGLSLEDVGKHLGLTKKTIQRYELAESRITDKNFEKLTELLDLDIEISINNKKGLQTEFKDEAYLIMTTSVSHNPKMVYGLENLQGEIVNLLRSYVRNISIIRKVNHE